MTPTNRDTITSFSNPLVKRLRSLERKKARSETGLFLAEGVRLISQGISSGWELETVMVSKSVLDRPHVCQLLAQAESQNAKIVEVPDRILQKVARKDNAQSVIAAFHQRQFPIEAIDTPLKGIWLGLYTVRDPGNLGTILRTADCAGIAGVVLIEGCCDPYSVEAVRASMGSIFDVAFANASFADFNAWRKAAGMQMVAASVNGNTRHDDDIYGERSLILMGNEQAGLPPDVEAECDRLALIPMRGGADSLNLAQATAIMTYEAWRQKGFS